MRSDNHGLMSVARSPSSRRVSQPGLDSLLKAAGPRRHQPPAKSDRHFRRRLLLLSNPEAAHFRDLAIRRRKELRQGDEQIARQARQTLSHRSGRFAEARGRSMPRAIGEGCAEPAQIIGHNSTETLATPLSTGVTSGPSQLFAGRPRRRTGQRIRAREELTMTSDMKRAPPTPQSLSVEGASA